MNFLKQHWTWIAGVIGVIATYALPSIQHFLASVAVNHPTIGAAISAVILFLAHISPSPIAPSSN